MQLKWQIFNAMALSSDIANSTPLQYSHRTCATLRKNQELNLEVELVVSIFNGTDSPISIAVDVHSNHTFVRW